MLRTFRRGDFFWSIDRQGTKATVRHGKAGGKAKERQLTIAADEKGRERYSRMVSERAEAGFVEDVPRAPAIDATGRALEAALVEEPGDLAAHMAYADWLSEQADARLATRGEFIRVQLALQEDNE